MGTAEPPQGEPNVTIGDLEIAMTGTDQLAVADI